MQQNINLHDEHMNTAGLSRLADKLIYLPGAAIIIYGFWLSLTVWTYITFVRLFEKPVLLPGRLILIRQISFRCYKTLQYRRPPRALSPDLR